MIFIRKARKKFSAIKKCDYCNDLPVLNFAVQGPLEVQILEGGIIILRHARLIKSEPIPCPECGAKGMKKID